MFEHKSVLLEETIGGLCVRAGGIYVDGTLGGAGHAQAICEALGNTGSFIGIDQDADAISAARIRLRRFGGNVTVVQDNYSNMKLVLREAGIDKVDGILLDLGVSSYQLDTPKRGFTYRMEAPLDMRMDQRRERTAKDIVNTYSEMELYRVIRDYGEERFARRIAERIVAERDKGAICTTKQLSDLIRMAIPMKFQKHGHPAKRTFQAIRIELNQELKVLQESLAMMIGLLRPKGRLCIITFHSLEDRIVKQAFRQNENPCTCPPEFPVCVCGEVAKGKVITRKPILPGEEELENNRRAKSAKLRIFEKR